MRHGKAEDGEAKADYKRKLISKGINRNHKIGQMLKDRKGKFDLIICSNATRTIETAEFMATIFDFPQSEIIKAKELYLAPAGVMLDFFYSLNNNISNVLFVGHNPGVSELVTSMSGKMIDWLPTSALIAIEVDTDNWKEIRNVTAKIVFSLFPKTS